MQKSFNKKIESGQKGFAMLVAIVTTSMLLLVSFVVANIAVKQLVLTFSSRESQYSLYNADSGIECATYWDVKNGAVSAFDPSGTTAIKCNTQTFTVGGAQTSTFTIDFTQNGGRGCAVVTVDKSVPNATVIRSRGYNICSGSGRRFERGVIINY